MVMHVLSVGYAARRLTIGLVARGGTLRGIDLPKLDWLFLGTLTLTVWITGMLVAFRMCLRSFRETDASARMATLQVYLSLYLFLMVQGAGGLLMALLIQTHTS